VLELTVRLVASLAVVVGLLLVLARVAGRRFAGRAGAPIQVLHRQSLSRSSSVAMISVGSRVLLVGTTDHQVSLLAEVDPDEVDLPQEAALEDEDYFDPYEDVEIGPVAGPPIRPRVRTRPGTTSSGPLSGSLLSPDTWKPAFAAAPATRP